MELGTAKTPPDCRIYAIGDIHGCIKELESLFALIRSDLLARPAAAHRIITVGDYCDRGPDSRRVVDFLLRMRKEHDLVCLRGNHDQRLLEFLDSPEEVGDFFLTYGGIETMRSYGVEAERYADLRQLSRDFRRALPRNHVAFFNSLKLMQVENEYLFVHAGIRPDVPLEKQSAHDMMWIRNAFLDHRRAHEKLVVHGHTITDAVDFQPNRINIDTGAFMSERLSCVVLEGTRYDLIDSVSGMKGSGRGDDGKR